MYHLETESLKSSVKFFTSFMEHDGFNYLLKILILLMSKSYKSFPHSTCQFIRLISKSYGPVISAQACPFKRINVQCTLITVACKI